jgi:ABC-type lipoprotein release transport system permease subunit
MCFIFPVHLGHKKCHAVQKTHAATLLLLLSFFLLFLQLAVMIVVQCMLNSFDDSVFHTLSEVKGTDTLSQEKQRVFTPFPDD